MFDEDIKKEFGVEEPKTPETPAVPETPEVPKEPEAPAEGGGEKPAPSE